jgi:ankyrin repeat protein
MKQFRGHDLVVYTDNEIEKALKEGFDLNTLKGTNPINLTPLIHSVIFNRISVFKLFIKYGADTNKTDNYDDTILHYICVYNRLDFLFFILSRGCVIGDVFNKKGYTPLREAIFWNGYICIGPLLEAGAKISNVKDTEIPDFIIRLVQKRNRLKKKIVLFLALSKKTKAVHKDLLSTISKMVWELRNTEKEEEKPHSKKKLKK